MVEPMPGDSAKLTAVLKRALSSTQLENGKSREQNTKEVGNRGRSLVYTPQSMVTNTRDIQGRGQHKGGENKMCRTKRKV